MEIEKYAALIQSLLPQGDCWITERNSKFAKIIWALAKSYAGIQERLDALEEKSYPNSDQSHWNGDFRVSFMKTSGGPLSLSLQSILDQLKFHGYPEVRVAGNHPEPGQTNEIYFKIPIQKIKHFSVGDPIGLPLTSWKDQKLESLLFEMVPAHCKVHIYYIKS